MKLSDVQRTILTEITWYGGRVWRANDDDQLRITMSELNSALGMLEIERLITRVGAGFVLTRRGARFVAVNVSGELVQTVGAACYYGYPPERLGYGPPGWTAPEKP